MGNPLPSFGKLVLRPAGLITILVSALVVWQGCVPLIYHCHQGKFEGIAHQLARTNVPAMHFLIVHGIMTHQPGYSSNLINHLTKKLGAQFVSENPAQDLVSPLYTNDVNKIRDLTYQITRDHVKKLLHFHELTWSPTTAALKTNAFEYDTRLDTHRSVLNRWMKDAILNDGFSDAMAYLNPETRKHLQAPIALAIHRIVDNQPDEQAVVLIASSLGSKMTFDTVLEFEKENETNKVALQKFAAQTTAVIMLANQIPLLGLATDTPGHSFREFIKTGHRERQAAGRRYRAGETNGVFNINILAATDPNDLLSYPLQEKNFEEVREMEGTQRTRVHVANTFSHNAWAILGVFEWPGTAHTAYDDNARVLKDMINGVDSQADCLPPTGPKNRQGKAHL